MKFAKFEKKALAAAILSCLYVAAPSVQAATINYTKTHVFSIDDIQGGFDGSMYGPTAGGTQDTTIICGGSPAPAVPGGGPNCPSESIGKPFQLKKGELDGVWMYPVDSEFGFYVEDYVGAHEKHRDDDYNEGWAGNVPFVNVPSGEDPGDFPLHPVYGTIGLSLADVATDKYRVTPPWGRWCEGAGGTSVKCETEHYVVMENIRSCYETIPYFFGDPDASDRASAQGLLYDPDPDNPVQVGDCTLGQLRNLPYLVSGGVVTTTELGIDEDGFPDMDANSTNARENLAATMDYAITRKDDGKALYRFGNMDKKPNDLRFYARMSLPDEWKNNPETAFPVTKAKLIVQHLITNNPNDQVRAEDMENEGAIGRKPEYTVVGDQWLSAKDCYEGDGDFIEEFTVLKNERFAYDPDNLPSDLRDYVTLGNPDDDVNGAPFPFSTDLRDGFTAGWYTTTDREPFEWAYDTNADGIVDVSTPVEAPATGDLISGPRWRLRPNKFGQDLPGLEIPTINCMETPYTSEFIKNPVLEYTVMEHNLLDFAEESPLLTSQGWIKPNGYNEPVGDTGISVNGAPLTEDFDLAIYIKGDRKAVAVYNAELQITYEGNEVPTTDFDAALNSLVVPASAQVGFPATVGAMVTNLGPATATGSVDFTGWYGSPRNPSSIQCSANFTDLATNVPTLVQTTCDIPPTRSSPMEWEAVLVAPGDTNPGNDEIPLGTYSTVLYQ